MSSRDDHDELESDADGTNAEESDVDGTVIVDYSVPSTPTIDSTSSGSAQHSVLTQEDQDGKMPPLMNNKKHRDGTHPGAASVSTKSSADKLSAVAAAAPTSHPGAHAIARAPPETIPSPSGPRDSKYQSTAPGSPGHKFDGMYPMLALMDSTTTTNTSAAGPATAPLASAPTTAATEARTGARVKFALTNSGACPSPAHTVGALATVDQGPDFKDQMRSLGPNQNKSTTKTNDAKLRPVPAHTRAASGPRFKDQADNMHSDGELVTEQDPELGRRKITEENEGNTDANPGTMIDESGDEAAASRHLVEAELVSNDPIDAAVEVYEENSHRKAWILVMVVLVIAVVLSVVLTQGETANPSPSTTSPPKVPTECINATVLELGGNAVAVVLGTNNTSILDDYPTLPTCGSAARITANQAGVWFSFVTNSTVSVRISSCTDNDDLNGDVDTQMLLFSGSCDKLICEKGNDNEQGRCGAEAGVSFQSLPSTLYYILVYGWDSATAVVGIQATIAQVSPSNDYCESATTLPNGRSLNSTVPNANGLSSDVECCNVFCKHDDVPSVWFLFESEVGNTTVSTCSPPNSLGHIILVYSGTCSALDSLACLDELRTIDKVEESWDCSGTVYSVQFFSESQSTYRIEVQSATDSFSALTPSSELNVTHRIDGDEGNDFAILARSMTFELASNDVCENSSPLASGLIFQGFTFGASADAATSCNLAMQFVSPSNGV
jgi:hypothetical protein